RDGRAGGRGGGRGRRDAGSRRTARRGRDSVIGAECYALTEVEELPECVGAPHDVVVRARPIGIALAAEWHGLETNEGAGTGLTAHPAGHVRRPAEAETELVHVEVQAKA